MKIDGVNNMQNVAGSVEKMVAEKPAYKPSIEKAKPVDLPKVEGVETNAADNHQDVINDEMLDKAIEVANKTLAKHNNFIERSVHDVTKTVMYVMKDTQTDEVIKEFPPKKIQDMIAKMWELAGLFVDEKA